MGKRILLTVLFASLAAFASAAILLQENFTSADNGTLPASMSASYDVGVDPIVVANSAQVPAPAADNSGGDGYSLRVGDIGSGGGYFNWVFPAAAGAIPAQTDCKLSAWVYITWDSRDATPLERDYLMMVRMQNDRDPQTGTYYRQGYMLAVTAQSSWGGISPNPPDYKAFIMKRSSGNSTLLSSYSTADVTTGWHYLTIAAVGSSIYGYVDGALVVTGTDSEYASGHCAIGYYEENGAANYPYAAAYDNFLYESVAADVSDWTLY